MENPSNLKLLGQEDRIFAGQHFPKPFAFNEEVAAVFDDMVHRSIPLYDRVTEYAAAWARRHYQPGTTLYDIGCSTGTTLELVGRSLPAGARLTGIDAAAPMLEQARIKLAEIGRVHEVALVQADASQWPLQATSFVILNYTLQFMEIKKRRTLLQSIAHASVSGGILFLSEKVRSPHPEFQETTTALYEEFKCRQGYSQREIARKKEALENVLVPLTEDELKDMVRAAGFGHVESLLKWNNFITLVAIKGDFSR